MAGNRLCSDSNHGDTLWHVDSSMREIYYPENGRALLLEASSSTAGCAVTIQPRMGAPQHADPNGSMSLGRNAYTMTSAVC